ncbi:MAG: signal recognition particle-docking protein FtsY [Deltaproteobacteria bacterium]|nr:MAG: signal recognition particle-docking protein FtsY [Deltaproteobacteria bacterium]
MSEEQTKKKGFFQRLKQGLSKTQESLVGRVDALIKRGTVGEAFFEELEEILYLADLGPKTTTAIIENIRERTERGDTEEDVIAGLKEEIRLLLQEEPAPLDIEGHKPYIVMVTGVNGVGKTTTIGKLGAHFREAGKSVLFVAADTFRAAAIEQLVAWGERVGCDVIKQKQGADPAAVAYDGVTAAVARKVDVALIDTAGRLHTKDNLMKELEKIRRVIGKALPGAPHESLLVLDATTGQNAFQQVRLFKEAVEISGLILTKLDSTAKGGCVIGVYDEFEIPIRYIGIGEKIEDLRPFSPDDFVEAIF